jgi:hypothetical protein
VPDATPSEDELKRRLVGRRFPGGTFRVESYERWLSHDAMQASGIDAPLLHPVWVLLGALRGMGMTIDDLIELAGSTADEGVVFGETILEQTRPLASNETYLVHGSITDLKRRESRRAGVIDLLTFRLQIDDELGAQVAASTQTFIFPRAGGSDAN